MQEQTIFEIVKDSDIENAFANTNFGSTAKRDVVKDTLLKCVCGFQTGWTASVIAKELGLINSKSWTLTAKGKRYLYQVIKELYPKW